MQSFRVQLMDLAEPDSAESDGEQASETTTRVRSKYSADALRVESVLRTASSSHWNVHHLILIRGLPGSGKTTLAGFLVQHVPSSVIVSESDYHEHQNMLTVPVYRSEQREEAKAACKQKAWAALQSGILAVVVDNENLKTSDMEPYVFEAVKRGYSVHLLEPNTPWRYNVRKLIKLTRKPVTLQDLQSMLTSFDRSVTADDLVREAQRKLTMIMELSSQTPLGDPPPEIGSLDKPLTSSDAKPDPLAEASEPVAAVPDSHSVTNEQEAEHWETADENSHPTTVMKSSISEETDVPPHTYEVASEGSNLHKPSVESGACAACCSYAPSFTFHPEPDPVDHLAMIFPNVSRKHIREFLDLAAGDIEWASSLILEGAQIGEDLPNPSSSSSDYVSSTIAAVAATDTHGNLAISQSDEPPSSAEFGLEPATTDPPLTNITSPVESQLSSTAKSDENTMSASKNFTITRSFIQEAQQLYGYALGAHSLDLSDAAVPDFLFDEWYPEPDLVRAILQSFLRFLGVTPVPAESNYRGKGSNRVNQQKRRNYTRANHPLNLADIMDHEEVIHRSVQDFRSSLDAPVVRRIIDRLMDKFPGVQRTTVEETFVKSDFKESETENLLRQLFTSSRLNQTTNDESTEPSTGSDSAHVNAIDAPVEPGLSLQEIQEEEEALRRSIEDQRAKLQSLASQLSLCRLKSQFPDIELLELENLFIRFDLREQDVTKYLMDRGFSAHAIAPLIPTTDKPATPEEPSPSPVPVDGDLDVLDAQLSVVRQRICQIRQRMFQRSEKGVGHYYSNELGRLYREQRVLSLARAQHLIDLRSANYERELLGSGDTDSSAAFKAFAYIDLHGLDKTCALTVLKQRVQLLEARLQQSKSNLPSCVIVITGRGGSVESEPVRTSPILRPAVINYLNSNGYPFSEKYTPGSGYFMVTLVRNRTPVSSTRR